MTNVSLARVIEGMGNIDKDSIFPLPPLQLLVYLIYGLYSSFNIYMGLTTLSLKLLFIIYCKFTNTIKILLIKLNYYYIPYYSLP